MSIASWRKEYLPEEELEELTEAGEFSVRLAEHTKKKYIGLRRANLEKHGLVKREDDSVIEEIDSEETFEIDGTSCVYCRLSELSLHPDRCFRCPLIEYGTDCAEDGSEYDIFYTENNPDPMIALMDKLIAVGGS